MEPKRFLELSLLLKGGLSSPAAFRTSVSRSDYAAFNAGVETLKTIGIQLHQSASGHGELVNCLGACNAPVFRKTSYHLRRLHGRRHLADYDMDDASVETRSEADHAYLEAQAILKKLDELKNDPNHSVSRSDMNAFARYVEAHSGLGADAKLLGQFR